MTDKAIEYTQEDINAAAQAESDVMNNSPEVLKAMNQHMNNRLVILRAHINKLEAQIAELQKKPARKAPADRQPKKRAAAKIEND